MCFLSVLSGAFGILFMMPASAGSLLIENVTLIDGTGRPPVSATSVLVIDRNIARIDSELDDMHIPDGTIRIDGSGKFLIPGLIDTHIHLPGGRDPEHGANQKLISNRKVAIHSLHGYLYSGVTSVYDNANNPDFILGLRQDERTGQIVSPRIFATGSAIAPKNGYLAGGGAIEVLGYEDGAEKVTELLNKKPDMIKFGMDPRGVGHMPSNMPLLTSDDLQKLIEISQQHGVRTTIHAVENQYVLDSVKGGIDALAHIPFYPLEDDTADLIARENVAVSSTLAVIKNISRVTKELEFFDEPLFQETLTADELEHHQVNERSRYLKSEMWKWADTVLPDMRENARKFMERGVVLAVGTDRTIGAITLQELENLVEVGATPVQAIKMGSLNGAIYLGLQDDLGSIEQGKLADMVLLDRDPVANIRNVTTIRTVIKDGKIIDRSALDLPVNMKE